MFIKKVLCSVCAACIAAVSVISPLSVKAADSSTPIVDIDDIVVSPLEEGKEVELAATYYGPTGTLGATSIIILGYPYALQFKSCTNASVAKTDIDRPNAQLSGLQIMPSTSKQIKNGDKLFTLKFTINYFSDSNEEFYVQFISSRTKATIESGNVTSPIQFSDGGINTDKALENNNSNNKTTSDNKSTKNQNTSSNSSKPTQNSDTGDKLPIAAACGGIAVVVGVFTLVKRKD